MIEPEMRRRRKLGRSARSVGFGLVLAVLMGAPASGCAGGVVKPAHARKAPLGAASAVAQGSQPRGARARTSADSELVGYVTPSLLLPDLIGERGVVSLDEGHRRV